MIHNDPLKHWRREDGTVDWANVPPGIEVGLEHAPLVPFHNPPPKVVAYIVPGAWETSFLIDPRYGTVIPHLSSIHWYIRTGTLEAIFSAAIEGAGAETVEDVMRPRVQMAMSFFASHQQVEVRVYHRWRLNRLAPPFVPDGSGDAPGLFWWGGDAMLKAFHHQWERGDLKPFPEEDLNI